MTANLINHDEVQASYDRIGRAELDNGLDPEMLMLAIAFSLLLWLGIFLITPEWLAWLGLGGIAALFYSDSTL